MASSSKVAENKEQVAPKVVQTQRESDFRASQQAQRESQSSRGNLPLGSGGREESSKTVKKVSWVEIAMQDSQKREASRSRVSSKKSPSHIAGFASVSKEATVVVDPVWETELLSGDGGGNTSLAKREC
jgi:hypothetical protein